MRGTRKRGQAGLWNACVEMEAVGNRVIGAALVHFQRPLRQCYEAGVQAPTLRSLRHTAPDMNAAALFLRRTLNDLRSTWLLVQAGYTSQAASVCAALVEHALSVTALAGLPENLAKLTGTASGDLIWSVQSLSQMYADRLRREAHSASRPFTEDMYERQWREIYSAYKFLCKIKHPTLRSTRHDAGATIGSDGSFVVMACPDLRPSDLPVKATVVMVALSRTYQAIRGFAFALEPRKDAAYRRFVRRMSRVVPAATKAYLKYTRLRLPFDIRDEKIAHEYFDLRRGS